MRDHLDDLLQSYNVGGGGGGGSSIGGNNSFDVYEDLLRNVIAGNNSIASSIINDNNTNATSLSFIQNDILVNENKRRYAEIEPFFRQFCNHTLDLLYTLNKDYKIKDLVAHIVPILNLKIQEPLLNDPIDELFNDAFDMHNLKYLAEQYQESDFLKNVFQVKNKLLNTWYETKNESDPQSHFKDRITVKTLKKLNISPLAQILDLCGASGKGGGGGGCTPYDRNVSVFEIHENLGLYNQMFLNTATAMVHPNLTIDNLESFRLFNRQTLDMSDHIYRIALLYGEITYRQVYPSDTKYFVSINSR